MTQAEKILTKETIPAGHFGVVALARALRIGSSTLQRYMQTNEFPAPCGYYSNRFNRKFAYYSLLDVQIYMDDPTADCSHLAESGANNADDVDKNQLHKPWAIPRHSMTEKRQCLTMRHLFNQAFNQKMMGKTCEINC